MKAEELAKTLDLTLLDSGTNTTRVVEACAEAREHHFAAVCTQPKFIPDIVDALAGADVKSCAVIALPHGDDPQPVKAAAAEAAIAEGVDEIDVVMNVPAMLSGQFITVRDDLAHLVHRVRARSVNDGRSNVIIKVIIEAPVLDEKLIRLACKIVDDCGADYAKTCTGIGTEATVHHVEIMRDALSENVGVKASGGIRTLEQAEELVNAGATRIGSSHAVSIIEEALAREAAR
jgi:deoxyribose-phosphate aldolase